MKSASRNRTVTIFLAWHALICPKPVPVDIFKKKLQIEIARKRQQMDTVRKHESDYRLIILILLRGVTYGRFLLPVGFYKRSILQITRKRSQMDEECQQKTVDIVGSDCRFVMFPLRWRNLKAGFYFRFFSANQT